MRTLGDLGAEAPVSVLPDGSGIPGHALQDDGRPYRSQGVEDVPADGPDGFTRCECKRSSGLRSSDASRRAWHARHLEDERARARLPVLAVDEVQGQHQDGGEHGSGRAEDPKVTHWPSRAGRETGQGMSRQRHYARCRVVLTHAVTW